MAERYPAKAMASLFACLVGLVFSSFVLAFSIFASSSTSRLSSGNRLFPTQVQITPTAIVHHTPHWFGRSEHSIHIAHVASVRVDTGVIFSDVYIETSGGAAPVKCHGHRKRDALEMQRLIEQFQSTYYRQQPGAPSPPVAQNETHR